MHAREREGLEDAYTRSGLSSPVPCGGRRALSATRKNNLQCHRPTLSVHPHSPFPLPAGQVLPQQRTSPASGASALGLLSSAAGGGTGGGLSSHSGGPGGPSPASTLSSSGPSSAPFVPSMALRLLPELRCCPVLLVKYNSRGAWLMGAGAGGGGGGSMKVMVDLQANSRWMGGWGVRR